MKKPSFDHIVKTLDNNTSLHYSWYEAMHTRIDILLQGKNLDELNTLSIGINNLILDLEKTADRFNSQSELYRVNSLASYKPIQISDHLFNILSDCLNANTNTQGLFDITINSPNHNPERIKSIKLDPDLKTVEFHCPETVIDLNGYVKGYTLDKIKELISNSSIEDALINLGNSSILGLGNQPFGTGWKIDRANHSISDIILRNECLTTSGNIFSERKHIKHPESHEYILGDTTISLITPTGALGEILSTSLLLATDNQQSEILQTYSTSKITLL